MRSTFFFFVILLLAPSIRVRAEIVELATPNYRLRIDTDRFRFSFAHPDGSTWIDRHPQSGLQVDGTDATLSELVEKTATSATFRVACDSGTSTQVKIDLEPNDARFSVKSLGDSAHDFVFRTASVSPGFGLSDHGGSGPKTTDVTGFVNEDFRAGTGLRSTRLICNFVIFPRNDFAEVNVEPHVKILRITRDENAQGSHDVRELPAMYYFLGPPKTIYASFLNVRNETGYKVYMPKYEFFGVGWEAFGALAWDTNQNTVTDNVTKYLDAGYPLSWMVIGSGFWPHSDPKFMATTSFGLWDAKLYPDPTAMIAHFHQRGFKVFLGLRIAFITTGPFAEEGVKGGYFMQENGQAKVFKIAFPKSPCYLLDATNPKAVEWYMGLCQKWMSYGVDGFKEDLFGYGKYLIRDDKLDPVNRALMDRGAYVMGRNGYLGSAMDIHRFEDFNFDQPQDRGPINGLAFAYSGFPFVYPDIVGGTFGEKHMPPLEASSTKRWFMRNAQYASVNPSMSVGFGPWNFKDPQVDQVVLDAAKLHARLHPYIYSAAVETVRDGFPHTLTPLSLAYPKEEGVYGRENTTVRGYEWLIGDSLLATPVYGDDYADADSRDVYLPPGEWMEYDSGAIHTGPTVLKAHPLPIGQTPLFVGGAGIVVEEIDHALHGRVYPIASEATYTHNWPDAKVFATIHVKVANWASPNVHVIDEQAKKSVDFSTVRHALDFTIQTGGKYLVTDGD